MHRIACIIAGLFFLGVCIQMQALSESPPEGYTTRCRIIRVIDGDTVEVEIRKTAIVRFASCYASEVDLHVPKNPTPKQRADAEAEKKRGLASKAHLVAAAEQCEARLHVPASEDGQIQDVFTFGRAVGELWLIRSDGKPDAESLSEMQVRAGYATREKTK